MTRDMTHSKRLLGALALAALLAAGCSGTDDDSAEPSDTAEPADTTDTTSAPGDTSADTPAPVEARGVTDDTINIAVTLVDFDALSTMGVGDGSGWGDQEQIWQALIDDVNANGGVFGRQLVPTFQEFDPVDLASSEAVCVEITQDEENFAVLGGFVGLVIESNNRFAQNEIAQFSTSPDAEPAAAVPWVSADASDARRGEPLVNLLVEKGTLEGDTIGVIGFESDRDSIDGTLLPALEDAGFDPAEVFYSNVAAGNQQALNAQSDVWSERIRSQGIDHIIFAANPAGLVGNIASRGYDGEMSASNGSLSLAGDDRGRPQQGDSERRDRHPVGMPVLRSVPGDDGGRR